MTIDNLQNKTIELIKNNKDFYLINLKDYKELEKAYDIVYKEIDQSIIITADNQTIKNKIEPKDIYKVLENSNIDIDKLRKLIKKYLNSKWHTISPKIDDIKGILRDQYIYNNSEKESLELIISDFYEQDIIELSKKYNKNEESKFIYPNDLNALLSLNVLLDINLIKDSRFISNDLYKTIRQNKETNELTRVNTIKVTPTINKPTIDQSIAEIKKDGVKITISDFEENDIKFKGSTSFLFDAINTEMAKNINNPHVEITLKDYMSLRDLKDIKSARQQVKDDLNALKGVSFYIEIENNKDKDKDFLNANLCEYNGIKNGVIFFKFTDLYHKARLQKAGIMYLPNKYFKLNSNKNPNSQYFMRKISEHKYMNRNKSNADIIAVKTLLEVTDMLPKYDDIKETGQIEQRIIKPFERDLDALNPPIKWEYCKRGNISLTNDELLSLDYDLFVNLLVKITWLEYPNFNQNKENKAIKSKS